MKVKELSRENLLKVLDSRHYIVGMFKDYETQVRLLGENVPYEGADIEDFVEITMDLEDNIYKISNIRPFYGNFNEIEFNALVWWVREIQKELESDVTEDEKNNLLKN